MANLILSLLLLLPVPATATAQPARDSLLQFVRNIDVFNHYFPQEKAYLHFDNTGYFEGETIWFKATVLRTDSLSATHLSRVLYVELVSPSGEVVSTQKLCLSDGQASGGIRLDRLLHSGFYEVRAYTRYMLNFDAACVFSRVLPVFGKPREEGRYECRMDERGYALRQPSLRGPATSATGRMSVRFYPEGGRRVRGLACRVAFEVTGTDGQPLAATGRYEGGDGVTVPVSTVHEGRGVLETGAGDSTGVLVLSDGQGRERRFPLPSADPEGCALRAESHGGRIVVTVAATGRHEGVPLGLVATNGGGVVGFSRLEGTPVGVRRVFLTADMPDGVSVLSVIDGDGDVLADRMVFVRPRRADSIRLEAAGRPTPYGEVTLTARARPHATFSLAVRDRGTMTGGAEGDAQSWLLLSSDLKGYIARPGYYFESGDARHAEAADLLMMTQGWRRYPLPEMMGRKTFHKRQPAESGLSVFGRAVASRKGSRVSGLPLSATLFNQSGNVLRGRTTTGGDGSYAFSLPDCDGPWTMALSLQAANASDYTIAIDRHFSPPARPLDARELSLRPLPAAPDDGMAADAADRTDSVEAARAVPLGDTHVLSTVSVRGRRLFENARKGWSSERRGQQLSQLFYDVDKEADALIDSGRPLPMFFEWLKGRNRLFGGSADEMHLPPPTSMEAYHSGYSDVDTKVDMPLDDVDYEFRFKKGRDKEQWEQNLQNITGIEKVRNDGNDLMETSLTTRRLLLQGQGLSYHGRPVVWVVDNDFNMISNCPRAVKVGDLDIRTTTNYELTEDMEGYKSVYISEDPAAWRRFLRCEKLEDYHPVTVFLYTHPSYRTASRGQRRTYFDGFAAPVAFESPDYRLLPKEGDHRRTLYWNPDVRTDGEGRATVSFFNNATCRTLDISAEGFADDGTPMVYR